MILRMAVVAEFGPRPPEVFARSLECPYDTAVEEQAKGESKTEATMSCKTHSLSLVHWSPR